MRRIRPTSRFRKDYQRELSGRHGKVLAGLMTEVLKMLVREEELPANMFDHPLKGNWNDHRDCHIRPDLVLIYRKPDDKNLDLVRLGSHSELGI